MNNDYKLYCIIVTYNAMKWIDRCLSSLLNSSVEVNIVVIDNLSKDATVEYIGQNYPNVYLIKNEVNKGFGQANNQGIEFAYKHGATHFLLLNQDAWVQHNTLLDLIHIQEKYNISIISPIHVSADFTNVDTGFLNYMLRSSNCRTMFSDLMSENLKDHYIVEEVNAACWLVNRKTIDIVGGFDPLFFHYGEDMDYLNRLKFHKGVLAIAPQKFVVHDRFVKGNEALYNKSMNRLTLLKLSADINQHRMLTNTKILRWYCHTAIIFFKELAHFRFKTCYNITEDYIHFFKSFGRIRKSRSINRLQNTNWLNI